MAKRKQPSHPKDEPAHVVEDTHELALVPARAELASSVAGDDQAQRTPGIPDRDTLRRIPELLRPIADLPVEIIDGIVRAINGLPRALVVAGVLYYASKSKRRAPRRAGRRRAPARQRRR